MLPFVSFRFLQFLLPCLINASLSVFVCVSVYNFHCFLPQQSDGLCDATRLLHSNWLPKQFAHTHVCVWIASTDLWYNGSSIRVWVWRRNSWSFFSFVFACTCVCDNFCEECAVVFAFRFCVCVCLPWRVICIAINGFHTQQFGFFRNQENK